MDKKQIMRRIKKVLQDNGYTIHRGMFIHIENNIAFGITIEAAQSCFYCVAFIMPLYIPASVIHFLYSNRLQNYISPINRDATQDEMIIWTDKLCETIKNVVFPEFSKVNTPKKLLEQATPKKPMHLLFANCLPIYKNLLISYTALFLHQSSVGIYNYRLRKEYEKADYFTPSVRNRLDNEISNIEKLSDAKCSEINLFFDDILSEVQQLFIAK